MKKTKSNPLGTMIGAEKAARKRAPADARRAVLKMTPLQREDFFKWWIQKIEPLR